MGWFDEQIRSRIEHDDEAFSEALAGMSEIVMGKRLSRAIESQSILAKNAIDEILKFYRLKPVEIPESIKDSNERLEYVMRPHGIMRRTVKLEGGWYHDAVGAMLGSRSDDGTAVALIPGKIGGYTFFDTKKGKRVRVTRRNASVIDTEAVCFYKPLPLKSIGIKDLIGYIIGTMSAADVVMTVAATLVTTLVGLVIPRIHHIIYSEVIVSDSLRLVLAIFGFLICASVSQLLITAAKSLVTGRMTTKLDISVNAAAMMRVLSMPASFFKDYSSGNLASRVGYIQNLCDKLVNCVMSTGLTSIFSLVYISSMINYGPQMVIPGLLVILFTVLYSTAVTFYQIKISKRNMEASVVESGLDFALISGVQKIKLAGAEKRAFSKWAQSYKKIAALTYDPPKFIKLSPVISTSISLIGTVVIYYFTIKTNVSLANYYAFNSAFGMVMGAFSSLVGITTGIAEIKPILEMASPILKTVPEIAQNKAVVSRLSGGVELNHVTFKYSDNSPAVINDLSLKIRPGQYVAIVGKTGCGKSTLIRLLLGFETPQSGAVYYDGRDISSLDLKSLRQKIGTVMQDGKLFSGDIYSNITVAAPWLNLDKAWEAAELAGIAEDIRQMPMGMHTVISEGSGGISGGQRQRLMIARAIAPKPRILILDEATSALDNITQRQVTEALDSLKCTKIVIAHRLSTIKHCDRILVLSGGKIAEEGTYEELIAKNGLFAELVARQRIDETD